MFGDCGSFLYRMVAVALAMFVLRAATSETEDTASRAHSALGPRRTSGLTCEQAAPQRLLKIWRLLCVGVSPS